MTADIPILGRRPQPLRTCRCCGCDDLNACVTEVLRASTSEVRGARTEMLPCAWVLLDVGAPTGVCSRCADEIEWHPALMATLGLDDDSTRTILEGMGMVA